MTKRVFLDTNHWITLTKVRIGIEDDPELLEIYNKIKKKSDTGQIIFPFSLFHLQDLLKNKKTKQRNDVIDCIVDISKGWILKSHTLFHKKEIENAVLIKMGKKPIHDIASQIIDKGISYTAGDEYHITSSTVYGKLWLLKNGDELKKHLDSIEVMKFCLKNEEFCRIVNQTTNNLKAQALKLEGNRNHRKNWSKTRIWDNEIHAFFNGTVIPHLSEFALKNNFRDKIISLFKKKSDIESFFELLPSVDTFIRLIFARDNESPERKIKPNDAVDINHLSGAIPYCDVVVAEKMFANLALKQKLYKKYNCIILSDIKKLKKILNN